MSGLVGDLDVSPVDNITAYLGSEIGHLTELEGQIALLEAEMGHLHKTQEKMVEGIKLLQEMIRRCVTYILWWEHERSVGEVHEAAADSDVGGGEHSPEAPRDEE
ncbi:hypothetical protein C8R43DRAFT_1143187 [Mycena crocata]|nr:hypothetical protein C8R43DRAFT_1143187 [Mycena crocata]